MIVALISAVTGLISGLAPDLLKEVKDSRAHTREMEFTKLNHQLALDRAKLEVSAKLEETQHQTFLAEIAATKESLVEVIKAQASYATGVRWLDGLNAFVRPATAMVFIGLFAAVIIGVVFGFSTNEQVTAASLPLFADGFMATLGFLFGYRSVSGQKKGTA